MNWKDMSWSRGQPRWPTGRPADALPVIDEKDRNARPARFILSVDLRVRGITFKTELRIL